MKNVSRAANAIFQFENPEKPVQPNTLCIRPVRWSLLFNDNPSIHQSNITLLQPLFLTAKGHNSHSCWRSLSVKCKFRLFWGIWTTESAVFLGRDILVLRLLSVGVLNIHSRSWFIVEARLTFSVWLFERSCSHLASHEKPKAPEFEETASHPLAVGAPLL